MESHAALIYTDVQIFIEKTVCFVKSNTCCLQSCIDCPGFDFYKALLDSLAKILDVQYHRWTRIENTKKLICR